jgi:uncharacterized protein YehS (DUF1456 family)
MMNKKKLNLIALIIQDDMLNLSEYEKERETIACWFRDMLENGFQGYKHMKVAELEGICNERGIEIE